jgi:glycosyltransferase involved in cell wall biosynthesis
MVEAMAAGVPVIATLSEGAREILDEDQTGRLIPIGDVEAMASTILDLLSDDKERVRLSENAPRVVQERFSVERMLDATEGIYRTVAD